MNHLSEKQFALLRGIVQAAPEGASLTRLADELGSSPSLLSRNLRALVEAGWAERVVKPTPAGREVHYRALGGVEMRWVDAESGIATAWTASDIDWEFPLVSRVPDAEARATLIAYLRSAREVGILDAPLRTTAVKDRGPLLEHLGLVAVVIGSAATGRVHRGSDVDLVVVTSDQQGADLSEQIEELGAEVSLTAPRAVQVRSRDVDDIHGANDIISTAARKDGIVVYDSLRKPSGGKDVRITKLIEGRVP